MRDEVNDVTRDYLERHGHPIHWKHWLMHCFTFSIAMGFGLLVDVQYFHWERAQPKTLWWWGPASAPTNWVPSKLFLPDRKAGYEIQIGLCEDGSMVWRPKR